MKLPYIDRIWRVRSSLTLEAPLSPAEAFERLDPLFQTNGTSYEVEGDTLTFNKHNPAAQDKLATFTRGTLRIIQREGRSELAYDLRSPALLLCFLAPLLFLAFAQITVTVGEYEKSLAESERGAGEEEEDEEEDEEVQLHPIDVFLGAPAPEKPDKDKEKEEGEDQDEDNKHSPKAAYILAAIFAALYAAGRILEPWLIKSTFRKTLSSASEPGDARTSDQTEAQRPG